MKRFTLHVLVIFFLSVFFSAEAMATYYLKDDATGGDCYLIGEWSQDTRTCLLTMDVTSYNPSEYGIYVETDNITIDGGGHTITGTGIDPGAVYSGIGCYWPRSGVVIKNVTIDKFVGGIFFSYGTNNLTITDVTIKNASWTGIWTRGASNVVIRNNTMTDVYIGIRMEGTNNSVIEGNSLSRGGNGINLVYTSSNNIISGNFVSAMNNSGLDIIGSVPNTSSDNNIVQNNTFQDIRPGWYTGSVFLMMANNTKIYNNNFLHSSGINDSGYSEVPNVGTLCNLDAPIGGNYWSDYPCSDLNADGFCDSPIAFYGGASDNLPWVMANGWVDGDADGFNKVKDCNDSDPAVNPSAAEIPYNGMDENCNGMADDDDVDHDGYVIAQDCNDSDPAINPSAAEILYNGIDDNCNGMADDDDVDHDGYAIAQDCNDSDPAVNPSAAEIPYNGIDENCSGMADDDDIDHDGYAIAQDCNDNDASIYPGASEIKFDGIDQDCNGYDMTITITKAHYTVAEDMLRAEATSYLGAAAALQLTGGGALTWKPTKENWTLTVQPAGGDPGMVTICGIEGCTSAATLIQ